MKRNNMGLLIKFNDRSAITIFQDEISLTFLLPFSGTYNNHLMVVYEDAYGDSISGILHKKTISDRYSLAEDIIDAIIIKLKK